MAVTDIRIPIIVTTVMIVLFIGLVVLLLILSHNRRIRHRAVLAEVKLARDREVMKAEREAQQQTLRDVGRELHDNLGQLLTVAQMGLDGMMTDPAKEHRMEEVMHAVELAIEEVRRMGRALNSDMWLHRSFSEALGAECERIERAGLAHMHLLVEEEPPRLLPDAKTILYRVFQEVVNNALKHAHANTIEVALLHGEPFRFSISDNGKGFDLASFTTGNGLGNIRHRCELIGFDAELASLPGEGTRWLFTQRPEPHAA